ncbi:MAG TPA: helix-turn-helix domain-containing protein, partial [Actinomycetota bacterium]|nr:helix-turn-helix domain-containing protein [Actinomycetota bacterium]
MLEVAVIEDPETAEVSLDPVRSRILAELAEPGSASSLAERVGLPRQNVNYHLRALEQHGLVELVEERRKGNMTERVLQATALSYVISPAAMNGVEPDPSRGPDRLSARWLIAVASKLVRDVGELVAGASKARKRLATFAMDGEIRF